MKRFPVGRWYLLLAIILISSLLFIPGKASAAGAFYDVPQTDTAFYEIESVYLAGIVESVTCPTGSPAGAKCYKPSVLVNRKLFAKSLVLAAGKTELKPEIKTFTDVPKTDPMWGFVERAADPASWGGNAPLKPCKIEGTTKYFCPGANIIRSDVASALTIGSGMPNMNPLPGVSTYSDVPNTSPFRASAETLKCKGIMSGTSSAGVFRPTGTITRRDMAVFMAKTFMARNVQGYTKEQKADNSVVFKGNTGVLVDGKLLGVSNTGGFFAVPFYLKKGTHIFKAQSLGTSVPFNVISASTDYGWRYVNSSNSACGPQVSSWISDIKVAAAVTMSGSIIDSDSGDLLTSTQLTVTTKNSAGVQINSSSATSDANGNFTISQVSPGSITLSTSKAGYSVENPQIAAQIGQTLADQEIKLIPNANFIEGNIKTDTGEPLSATVTVPAPSSFYGRDMTFATDFTGHYKAFGVKPGVSPNLTISAPDFLDKTRSVASPAGTRQTVAFDFTFITSGSGSMVDTRPGSLATPANQCAKDTNGNIVKETYVVLSNGGTYSGGEYPEQKYYLKTDANGCLTLGNIPAGMYGVSIFKDNSDGTTTYYAIPGDEQQITIDHNQVTNFPLNGLRVITP